MHRYLLRAILLTIAALIIWGIVQAVRGLASWASTALN